MNLRRDNKIVVDLRKCQFAKFYYRNQHGQARYGKPNYISVHGVSVDTHSLALPLIEYPGETIIQRLHRRGEELDKWTPELLLKLSANHALIYTGDKATKVWNKWCELIYG